MKSIEEEYYNTDSISLNTPPNSIESERALLGALLLKNELLDEIVDIVSETDFYVGRHKTIYTCIKRLIDSRQPADVITVSDELGVTAAEEVGGLVYLNQLTQYIPSTSHLLAYAKKIHDCALLRKLGSAADNIKSLAMGVGQHTAGERLEAAEKAILAIADTEVQSSGVKTLNSQILALIDRLQEGAENPNIRRGVLTGLADIDQATSGLQGGDLVVIAGRPSMGKTALAMSFTQNALVAQDLGILFFSLEMNAEPLTDRLVCSLGRINQTRFKSPHLFDDREWQSVTEVSELLLSKTLDYHDADVDTLSKIKSATRRYLMKHKKPPGLIVLDYLQLMSSGSESKADNRTNELADISRGLKLLAKEMKCPVIALSQLNRGVESRADKRPMMSDLRESGAIEQDADIIMLLYRDEYYTKEACREPGVAEVIIAKQRNGPVGTVKVRWTPEYGRFDDLN